MDRSTADVLSADGRKMPYQTLASGLGVGNLGSPPFAAMDGRNGALQGCTRACGEGNYPQPAVSLFIEIAFLRSKR